MTTACNNWSPFRYAVTGYGAFQMESDSNVSATFSGQLCWDDQGESALKWRIFELVRQRPGIMKSEVADFLGLDLAVAVALIREMRITGYLRRA